jgi:tetratricopeptide (TPR) repeat protein
MRLRAALTAFLVPSLLLVLGSGACSASEARRSAREGARAYDRGDYDTALPLLEKAIQKGMEEGELHYQVAYIYALKGRAEEARAHREKAAPLLEQKAADPEGSVEIHYYLTALYANLGRMEEMRRAAERAVTRFGEEKDLGGSDLFRLGRMYQFLGRVDAGAASYRRAVEAFAKEKDPSPVLHALALAADGRNDFAARRFADAVRKFRQAGSVHAASAPGSFETALALLGAGEFPESAAEFGKVRDESSSEAQYGADIAKRLGSAGGFVESAPGGTPLPDLDNAVLEEAIRSAAAGLRAAREAKDPVAAGGPGAERLFFSLVAEWMLRGNRIREAALAGDYARLIRQ